MTSMWDDPTLSGGQSIPGCGRVCSSTQAPGAPTSGDLWFDTGTDQWKKWDGSNWVVVAAGGGGAGANLPMATKQGQVLVSQGSAGFPWVPEDGLIEGTF